MAVVFNKEYAIIKKLRVDQIRNKMNLAKERSRELRLELYGIKGN